MTKSPSQKKYGVIDSDKLREMSGLEFVQGLVKGSLPLNSMARAIGYDIVEASQGRAVVTASSSEEHLNPEGTVHGGIAATLLDTCMGLAVRSMLEKGYALTTLEFKITFLRPITKETGALRAEGTLLTCGRRVGAAEGRLTDSSGRLLAHGTSTCMIAARPSRS
jgi:uncharacterized protein (TIGR00369 family)